MGEWERVAVPPDIAKKDKGAAKLGLLPHLSAMKMVYERRQHRKGVAVWDYPSEATLLAMEVNWHDFKSVASIALKTLEKREKDAAKAKAREAKPVSDDQGGMHMIKRKFDTAERERKEHCEKMQKRWDERDTDINQRLQEANDAHARALPVDKEATQMAIDSVKEELDNFCAARSQEKVALEETRKAAKRKLETDLSKQRAYNKNIKSGARKKAKAAYAQSPIDVEVDSDPDADPGMPDATARTVALARDPVALASRTVAKAAVHSVLCRARSRSCRYAIVCIYKYCGATDASMVELAAALAPAMCA
jgi:hypothetical protein